MIPELGLAEVAAAGRRLPEPFTLRLVAPTPLAAPLAAPAGSLTVTCRQVLRLLPGRRLVARAEIGGAPVLLKLFLGAGAERYAARERRGCEWIAAAGAATPRWLGELRGAAQSEPPARGLLFEYLERAAPVAAHDDAGVAAAAAELARLHQGGCRQRDLHLDNFLLQDGRALLIDGDGVRRVRGGAVDERQSLRDLARLGAQRPPLADRALPRLFEGYAAVRGWRTDGELAALLPAAVREQRRRRVKAYLEKTERDCTEFLQRRRWDRWLVAVRCAWDDELAAFADDPERFVAAGRVLKAGNSATVVRVSLGGEDRVIKRYNLKGPWHALRRALKPAARYRVAWRNGQRLVFLDIPTARPLLLLEKRWGPLRGVAYLVMEDLGGRDLPAELDANGLTEARVAQVARLFRALAAAGLRHGDTKASNFLVTPDAVALVDLDALREGGGQEKDVARFLANFDDRPDVRERFRQALATTAADGGFAPGARPL